MLWLRLGTGFELIGIGTVELGVVVGSGTPLVGSIVVVAVFVWLCGVGVTPVPNSRTDCNICLEIVE